MKFLICVDTSSDRKRARLNKSLLKFGERVQYSVFEFNINDTDFIRLKHEIEEKAQLKDGDINVNIYHLPDNYIRKIERLGSHIAEPIGDQEIVVF